MNRRRNESLVKMTMTAILMSLAVLLSRFLSVYINIGGTPLVEIGFQTIPVLVCSLVCGPFYGALCGGGVDLITALAFPVGPFFPGFTLDAALLGLLPGLALKWTKRSRSRKAIFSLVILALSTIGLSFTLPFVEELKLGESHLVLPLWLKIVLPLIYFLVAAFFLSLSFFLDRRIEKRKRFPSFSLFDCFLAFYSRDLFVRPFLAPVWLLFLYGVPYEVSFLSQLLGSFLTLPIEAVLLYVVLIPVSIVCKREIQATYPEKETRFYSKLVKGRNLSNPFLSL